MSGDTAIERRRLPVGVRLGAVTVVIAAAVVATVFVVGSDSEAATPETGSPAAAPVPLAASTRWSGIPGEAGPGGRNDRRTLVLYDDGRRYAPNPPAASEAQRAQAYAMFTANLVSRANAWRMHPVGDYEPGEANRYQSIVYIGSVYDGLLPQHFLTDVANARIPVLWIGGNIWQLFDRTPGLDKRLGWTWGGYRTDRPTTVNYRGFPLRRSEFADTGVMGLRVTDPRRTQVLAEASTPDGGARSPWAVRSGQFSYLAEVPYAYAAAQDRYLAAADILLGTLAPETVERHRALVRIEDVGPRTDPKQLRAITDYLAGRGVPFSLAVYPYYADPQGKANNGRPTFTRLVDRPELVEVLRDATRRGGTLIMHGYSHQNGEAANPYDGVSASDYEFYGARTDDRGNVLLTGPVPGDSPEWFRDRIATGLGEFERVGLGRPEMFEFPHYGGSAVDYHEVTSIFGARYDRGSYYAGQCPGGLCGSTSVSYDEVYGQFFPYAVRDVYGSVVVPENVGNVAPAAFNQHNSRSEADMLADARANRVVRDSVASFFYHPFLGTAGLAKLVDGISELGYRFASPGDIMHG
ncbi:uncharacterized protein YdaL [Herbihabitans rhizosphaerae]|uniref:Uncharacterized protein YdaL n=1 Tax=Herbihabitans rhizosphaerae TaxID=1872711 RepID=A0A4Q7KFM2_9PSEU|nr:polysaccharide deacetylase family protein [Herbihabitans rhizosphaerae]RZS34012.1 uncharacterized protein YdaL [Herbihabitans rhizosphaerae]